MFLSEITETRIFCAVWCSIGFAIGMIFSGILDNQTVKKLREQRSAFIEMTTKLSVKFYKLNQITKRLIVINEKILKR